MKNMIKQVFHSPKFVVGFVIFMAIFVTSLVYPLFVKDDPLEMIGAGSFFEPGTYINVNEVIESQHFKLHIDATNRKIDKALDTNTRNTMKEWLVKFGGVEESSINTDDALALVNVWQKTYSEEIPM